MSTLFKPIQCADLDWREGLPFAREFADVYFMQQGLNEKRYVFLEGNRLAERWKIQPDNKIFIIAETGFGTGLNFLLAWSLWQECALPDARLHFISCDKHPLQKEDLARCLMLWPQLQAYAKQLLSVYPVLTPGIHTLFLNQQVTLTLMLGDAVDCYSELLACGDDVLEKNLRPWYVDVWFLDGFAPAKNPDMWQMPLLMLMRQLSTAGTTFSTFSAAGEIKRGLEALGFRTEKCKGYGQKRAMLRGELSANSRLASVADQEGLKPQPRKSHRLTPWAIPTPCVWDERRAIILGAGLAGCYLADALTRRGWQVTVIDARDKVGCGASGNAYAVLYPQLSAYRSPLTEFMLNAYLFAVRTYQSILTQRNCGELKGILQLSYRESEQAFQQRFHSWLQHYPELGRWVEPNQASKVAGLSLTQGGLFIPQAGWLNVPELCQFLIDRSRADWLPSTHVSSIHYEDRLWHVAGKDAPVLILANGYMAHQFAETNYLQLKAMHGQMTMIEATDSSAQLNIPLSGDAHVVPAHLGFHGVGATYHPDVLTPACFSRDDNENLANLAALPTQNVLWSSEISGHWRGIRGACPDYLPVVGPVADPQAFAQRFAVLAHDNKRWVASPGTFYPGLFVCAGFGSRGLTSIPRSAEYLASLIHQEPHGLPRHLVRAISSARFLLRTLSRRLT